MDRYKGETSIFKIVIDLVVEKNSSMSFSLFYWTLNTKVKQGRNVGISRIFVIFHV